jgi:hypothetical protein
MTDPADTTEAQEADDAGDKPDLGHTRDTLVERLTGTDSGSDTRSGSLQGGSAGGSDEDPDSDIINAALARKGRAWAAERQDEGKDGDKDPT